ncbi:MAG TPA: TetR/AcrR family transcriptional regulator [Bryobacteraceae bacterium]|nr:TetR/AcrR family transcriptional regulator [Bryobacteraceae bacterium]
MARPKEFDRDEALQKAIGVFCEKGYAAASTDELMHAMKISRQSMYDTYGDKRQLYLEAFRRYAADSVSEQISHLEKSSSPLAGIEKMLVAFATRTERDGITGCMGINAVCEFGRSDPEVTALGNAESVRLSAALEQAVRQAKAKKEISKTVEEATAAQFLQATLAGLKVAAKAGADTKALKSIAHFALRSLTSTQ